MLYNIYVGYGKWSPCTVQTSHLHLHWWVPFFFSDRMLDDIYSKLEKCATNSSFTCGAHLAMWNIKQGKVYKERWL